MNEFEDVLRRLAEQVEQPVEVPEPPKVSGEGHSEDEMVRITVSGGEVEDVSIDPRSLRKSSVELADDIRAAVNGAIGAHNRALHEAMTADAPDPAAIGGAIDGIREEAARSLDEYLDKMTAMLEQHAARQG
ncbi:YbaB/EbfC family nucleoid-associated protein [Tessaracoccus rhinocerotis]|uniref:YbaB/EbfC family nucleoid-associated protein n=1 Tax=Tessaracoccus rhinocerotis TaxID=1689449 RepID=A0A553K239_9ACTN|nr:YbaB/EbfC family nucleoid-associated protein [Tessaracoccus rhinocerotis]TRY18767.1 YbaB/EbfC family nucleoid-associated protein [Tessaracoccus rhinocerotis]